MSEIVNASAVRFDNLPPTGDGYTLLSINGKVYKSDKFLSEMVQSAVDKQVEDKLDTTAFNTVSGNFLTAHQKISANEWNSCYETVSANSGIWGTEHDWITEIKDASANAFNEASAWVEEQNYITGVDLSNYYTKNETSSVNELTEEFNNKQDKLEFNYYNDTISGINNSGIYSDSWKLISEKKNSKYCYDSTTGNLSVYIGQNNSAISNDSYTLGRDNFTEQGVNIGYDNIIDVNGLEDIPGNVNIGKNNSVVGNPGAVNIGQRNSANSWGVNLGEDNSASLGGYNLGMRNKTSQGSCSIGESNESTEGSYSIGKSNKTTVAGYTLGERNSAESASISIGVSNTALQASHTFGSNNLANNGSVSIGLGSKADNGSFTIGNSNISDHGSFAAGINAKANNCSYAIGNNLSADNGSISMGFNSTATSGSIALGFGNNNAKKGSFILGNRNFAFAGTTTIGDDNTATYTDIIGNKNNINASILNVSATSAEQYTKIIGDPEDPEPETIQIKIKNFVAGLENTATFAKNTYIFGNYNKITCSSQEDYLNPDNDGYTFIFGMMNSADRNYDMAIGYSAVASGGENIAIGSPQVDPYYGLLWNTNAVGYRNIAIRSNISGIGNIVFESKFEGKGINNIILNSQITGATDNYAGYSEYPIARNDIRYSNGILNIGNDFTDNVIKTTTANIDCKGYCVNNTIQNSYIDITVNDVMISNFINTTTATGTTDTFRHNVIFFSDIDVTSGDYNFSYNDIDKNHSNFLVGVSARNVIGTFGFADKYGNSLQEVVRSYSFGDNHLNRVRESTVFGQSNYLSSTDKSFVVGNGNSIHVPCSGSNDEPASMELIIGFDNIMEYSSITSTNCRNKIIGNTNQFYSDGETTDNFIIGNNNKFFYFDSILDNREYGYPELPYYADENTFACYRNMVFGTYNAVSQYISNGFIVGDSNVIMTDNVSDKSSNKKRSKYDSSVVFGFGNVAYNGSKQIAMGDFNTVSGHFAYAFGEDLSAQDFQMVVGKYNAPVPKTTRTTSAWVNDTVVKLENSGILFAIGNGRLNCYEKDGKWYDGIDDEWGPISNPYDESLITRSNALTVSANGVVSASDYITSGNYKLSELNEIIDFLRNKPLTGTYVMKCIDGTLTWVVDNT